MVACRPWPRGPRSRPASEAINGNRRAQPTADARATRRALPIPKRSDGGSRGRRVRPFGCLCVSGATLATALGEADNVGFLAHCEPVQYHQRLALFF